MTSIRNKLFIQIGLLIATLFTLLILVNTLLLDSFYIYRQHTMMIESFQAINTMDYKDYESNSAELASIQASGSLDILISDHNNKIIYATNNYQKVPRGQHVLNGEELSPPIDDMPLIEVLDSTTLNEKYQFTRIKETNFDIENLILFGQLDSGHFIELRIPIETIETSIDLTNEILVYFGLSFFILSMIFAYILSNSFTRPIREMNIATKGMQSLDFSRRCEITSKDELGQLSQNINQMSETLAETILSLHTKDENRRILLNNVSHELKTPLALMQGYSVALKNNVHSHPERTDFYCDVIEDETQKMAKLVSTLLDIDQIDLNKTKLNLRVFEINDFLEDVFRKFQPQMDASNLQYHFEPISQTKVQCDPLMVERVMKNLLSNAINYVNEDRELRLSLQNKDKRIRVEIFNSAEPIPEEELVNLWESFYKVDKARTREKGGHGLGLSIVKAIQIAHNQDFGVYNVSNGLCFWFEIATPS